MKTTSDISAMLKDLFSETMQEMLEAEMDTTLGYGKNENAAKQTDNRRNGHSKKTVISEYGDTELRIPRDREGEHGANLNLSSNFCFFFRSFTKIV